MRVFVLIAALPLITVASLTAEQPAHTHDGFYLSMDLGPAFGDIDQSASNARFSHASYGGSGAQFGFRIGGAVTRNFIVSFDVSSRAISDPTVRYDGGNGNLPDDWTASNAIAGIGFTYYFMPTNAFVGITLGQGSFRITDNHHHDATSKNGFGYVLRGGKEWWVSKHWGLGIVGGLAHLSADDKYDPTNPAYSPTLSTTQGFVGFSATFN